MARLKITQTKSGIGYQRDQRNTLRDQMSQAYGILATQEYIDALKAKTEVKIAADRM